MVFYESCAVIPFNHAPDSFHGSSIPCQPPDSHWDARVGSVPFNAGRGTDPSSFVFRGNAWFRPDSSRKPTLPAVEKDGIYDLDPMILDLGSGPLAANTADPRIRQVGPWEYQPWKPAGDFADITVPPVVLPER